MDDIGKLFRRLLLTGLLDLHEKNRLTFYGDQAMLTERPAFRQLMTALRRKRWIVHAKPVLAFLSRYTHRVAIANRRVIAFDESDVIFRYYRRDGAERRRTMTLAAGEFIRRFLLHVLPKGFRRIRHYGLLGSAGRKANVARARELIAAIAATPAKQRPKSGLIQNQRIRVRHAHPAAAA